MQKLNKILCVIALLPALALKGADAGRVLDLLDLSRPGLEKVAEYHNQGKDSLASVALLEYYKTHRCQECGRGRIEAQTH